MILISISEAHVTNDSMLASRTGAPLTISIHRLRTQNNGSEVLVGVVLESGEHREQRNLVITTEQYCEWKLQKGPIDEQTYEQLEDASELSSAVRCGEHLLSYGANSKRMLAVKISQRGFSREMAARAVERLCRMGLICEESDLRREVERCLQKLWGRRRISAHLWTRGFGSEAMEQLPELLDEVDFPENCATLIRKHYGEAPKDQDEARKMIAFLSRYGYQLSEIREALQKCK
ncbi:MAG: RecX family transcriptional regulator [Clostridia bacterium]|nr:RecX family transcriptional regulator [Clostridia bacterium]